MANLFGGNDEALSKDATHPNQANLVFAVIPRSASKVIEVINGLSITNLTGAYDADGYWHPNTTTRTDVEFDCGEGYTPAGSKTIISGWYYDGSAGAPTYSASAGMRNSSTGISWSIVNISVDGTTCITQTRDQTYAAGPTTPTFNFSSNSAAAFAHAQDSAAPAQKGWKRVGTSNTAHTPTAVTFATGGSNTLNKVGFRNASRFRFRYLFVYNASLSDYEINAIMDQPGAVLTSGSVFDLVQEQGNAVVCAGEAVLTGDPYSITKYWRVPSNAAQGTTGRMIVFAAGSTPNAVAYEGSVTADANGNFNLITTDVSAGGTKRFAVVHAWNGVTGTTSIYGGPGISELIST